jgi:L-lactate utilization protein LutC
MSARDRILGRVRAAAEAVQTGDRAAAIAARLAAHSQPAPIPAQGRTEGAARIDQFEAKLKAVDATVTRIAAAADLPEALAEQLRRRNLPKAARFGADPMFAALDWSGIETSTGPGRLEEPATLSRAAHGVAETGTLALTSGPDNPVTLTFLGETHFVAIRQSDVAGGFEEMWARFRESGADPRTVNLVTGPSRSADIGQKLQLGAHGPIAVHVFLIEGE